MPAAAAAAEQDGNAATPSALALFASRLSRRRFGDEELRVLEAALSAGADVPALLATRSAARSLLRASAAEAFASTATGSVLLLDGATSLAVADFFARAFALVGDVEDGDGGATPAPDALSLFASRLSLRRFGDEELRVLEAALSAGADVPALLATRSAARSLLRASAAEAFASTATGSVLLLDDGAEKRSLAVADFFARAFALVGDVESCLAMRYEALLLRDAKYCDDLHLKVSRQDWLTFAKDSLDNGFYTIASKAFANALAHIHPSHPGHLDSANSIEEKDKINDIIGLQNLAKSLSAQHSVQTQSAEYMKKRASGFHEKYNSQSVKSKLPASSMFMLGIKTRNIRKLLHSREKNLG